MLSNFVFLTWWGMFLNRFCTLKQTKSVSARELNPYGDAKKARFLYNSTKVVMGNTSLFSDEFSK